MIEHVDQLSDVLRTLESHPDMMRGNSKVHYAVVKLRNMVSAAAALGEDSLRGPFGKAPMQPCWEISTAHICEDANDWLTKNVGKRGDGLFIEVASMERSFIIKLIAAPWTDVNLSQIGVAAPELLQGLQDAGVPPSLISLLQIASLACARFLVLDGDADQIDGLPVYDW